MCSIDKYNTILEMYFLFLMLSLISFIFIVRKQHIIHITYKLSVNPLLMLLVRVLKVKFGGIKSHTRIFDSEGNLFSLAHTSFKGQL